jgi:hypothetical protein
MPRGRILLAGLFVALLAARALAVGPGEIAQETLRSAPRSTGVLQVWWLPAEYWEAAAEKQSWSAEQRRELRERIRNYFVLGVLDATLGGTSIAFAEHAEIAERMSVERNGSGIEPLRKIDPRLAAMIPELSYFIRVSLGPLKEGMRLLFFPNLAERGEPVLSGSRSGELRVRYRPEGAPEPTEFRWRPPLTSIVGSATCPEGGEALEASWTFCPWHGVKVRPDPRPE